MPREGFESETPATMRPQTYSLDRAATEIGQSGPIGLKKEKLYDIRNERHAVWKWRKGKI
jgi:hypothetical protein